VTLIASDMNPFSSQHVIVWDMTLSILSLHFRHTFEVLFMKFIKYIIQLLKMKFGALKNKKRHKDYDPFTYD